jgi:hypothetical protein
MVRTKWLASLSDGTTIIEDEGKFVGDEESSPWAKLLKHLDENGLTVTGLRVQLEKDGEAIRTYNLPSHRMDEKTGQHEKWRVFPVIPKRYDYFRWVSSKCGEQLLSKHIEIRAIYDRYSVSLFVDELEGNEAWVVVHNNSNQE